MGGSVGRKLDEVETLCVCVWVWAWDGGLMTWVAGLRIVFHSFVSVLSPCSMSFNEFVDTVSSPHGVQGLEVCKCRAMEEGRRHYMQPMNPSGCVSTASSGARHVFTNYLAMRSRYRSRRLARMTVHVMGSTNGCIAHSRIVKPQEAVVLDMSRARVITMQSKIL